MQNMQNQQELVYKLQRARDDYYKAFYWSALQQWYQYQQLSFNFSDFTQQNQEKQSYQQFFLNFNLSFYWLNSFNVYSQFDQAQ